MSSQDQQPRRQHTPSPPSTPLQQQPSPASVSASPRHPPPSPTLKPLAHRIDPGSATASTSQSSITSSLSPLSSSSASATLVESSPDSLDSFDDQERARQGASSAGSSSSSGAVGASEMTDMTSSVISTLDLDDSNGDGGRGGGEIHQPPPPPLVREDTATKAAMLDVDASHEHGNPSFDSETPSPSTSRETSSEQLETPSSSVTQLPIDSADADDGDDEDTTEDEEDEDADADAAPHEPKTAITSDSQPETVPTVSATGMPRFLPRSLDDPTKQSHIGSTGPPPAELQPEQRTAPSPSSSDSPTGSLTLAALTPSSHMTLRRRVGVLSASIFINLGLPFVNGVMLGFGEIFARSLVAPFVIGHIHSRWPGLRRTTATTGIEQQQREQPQRQRTEL